MLPNALRALSAATLAFLATGCGGSRAGAEPGAFSCDGDAQIVVTNQQAQQVRVVEHSTIEPSRILGEIPSRGTRTYPVRPVAGVYYAVVVVSTGELLASEAAHPRGRYSDGATIERRCTR